MSYQFILKAASLAVALSYAPAISAQTLVPGGAAKTVVIDTGAADVIPPPNAGGPDVGISSRDGITFSAPDVLVTRNGVTQRLTKPLALANGTRVFPDGTILNVAGTRMMIRPEQVLTFGGTLADAPIVEVVPTFPETVTEIIDRTAFRLESSRARPASRRLPRIIEAEK